MAEALLHPFREFNFTEVGCAKRCAVEHLLVNRFNDFWMGMAVDEGPPRLDKVNQDISIDIRDVSA